MLVTYLDLQKILWLHKFQQTAPFCKLIYIFFILIFQTSGIMHSRNHHVFDLMLDMVSRICILITRLLDLIPFYLI